MRSIFGRTRASIRPSGKRRPVMPGRGVYLVDAARILAQNSPDGIPGLELFYEHVHLNFAGNYLLALNFAEQAKKLLPNSITAHDKGNWASAELCDRRLAVTVWDRQRVWQPILNRITSPPFTGQFNHAANLKVCEAKLDEAKSQMNFQTPEQARQMYEQALALAPDDSFLHGNFEAISGSRGVTWHKPSPKPNAAANLFHRSPEGYYYTGTLLVREGKISEAADYFSRAIAIRSDYAEAEDAMGEILANQQKTAEAIHWFKRAIRSNPDYADTYLNLGFLQQNQGEIDAAMASYQKAASLEPEGPADYFNRANTAAALYRWDEVIACLRAARQSQTGFLASSLPARNSTGSKRENRRSSESILGDNPLSPRFYPGTFLSGNSSGHAGKAGPGACRVSHSFLTTTAKLGQRLVRLSLRGQGCSQI